MYEIKITSFWYTVDLDFVCIAVVLNEAEACSYSYGRQSLFHKIQASLQGTILLTNHL